MKRKLQVPSTEQRDFDAEYMQLVQKLDVLVDPALRAAVDQAYGAKWDGVVSNIDVSYMGTTHA